MQTFLTFKKDVCVRLKQQIRCHVQRCCCSGPHTAASASVPKLPLCTRHADAVNIWVCLPDAHALCACHAAVMHVFILSTLAHFLQALLLRCIQARLHSILPCPLLAGVVARALSCQRLLPTSSPPSSCQRLLHTSCMPGAAVCCICISLHASASPCMPCAAACAVMACAAACAVMACAA